MTQLRIKATPPFTFWVFAKECIPARAIRLASVLTAISALAVGSVSAQSEIEIATAFSGGKLTELSGMKTTLSVQPFADEREVSDPRVIFTGELADGGVAMASRPLAEIVGEAMHSAFAASDARLAGDEAGMRLAGTLVATDRCVSRQSRGRVFAAHAENKYSAGRRYAYCLADKPVWSRHSPTERRRRSRSKQGSRSPHRRVANRRLFPRRDSLEPTRPHLKRVVALATAELGVQSLAAKLSSFPIWEKLQPCFGLDLCKGASGLAMMQVYAESLIESEHA